MNKHFLYMGKMVPTEHFRAFVYGVDGKQRLVNSHNEFIDAMASGLWFESKQAVPVAEAEEVEAVEKPKSRKRKKQGD